MSSQLLRCETREEKRALPFGGTTCADATKEPRSIDLSLHTSSARLSNIQFIQRVKHMVVKRARLHTIAASPSTREHDMQTSARKPPSRIVNKSYYVRASGSASMLPKHRQLHLSGNARTRTNGQYNVYTSARLITPAVISIAHLIFTFFYTYSYIHRVLSTYRFEFKASRYNMTTGCMRSRNAFICALFLFWGINRYIQKSRIPVFFLSARTWKVAILVQCLYFPQLQLTAS
ncbi:hypothetical protein FN846DRAFT_310006 [Sphaerosporella brunnea]|uniref:Uncharacterized protein n=1 Tax=Sphaerosporella brunnea TaxID=1250544 RepID=A0A5J5F7M9_9PEZI|nr:hypothetical protein FN846DRAFT_310006 [Sphaerosporella brunnea]